MTGQHYTRFDIRDASLSQVWAAASSRRELLTDHVLYYSELAGLARPSCRV